MGIKKFLDSSITARVDELLVQHREEQHGHYRALTDMLQQIPHEQREALERYIEAWNQWSMDEFLYVYKEAFQDGLRLGHNIFK